MTARFCVASFLIALTSLPLPGTPQNSLGEIARQLREERAKAGVKSTKVYTNDNLPGRKPGSRRAEVKGESSTSSAPAPAQTQAERNPAEAVQQANQAPLPSQPVTKSEMLPDNKGSKEYWQARFKSARARLADAQERQQLVEDEINLLQIQEIRALDPKVKSDFDERIKAKGDELSERRAATQEAQKALDDLQTEFKASGAPEEWSQASESSSQ